MAALRLLALLALALSAGAKPKDRAPAVKEDVKYIRCGVCQELAKSVARDVRELREAKGTKLKEEDILAKVEQACDPETQPGAWIARLDLVERGRKLAVEEQPTLGKCGTECRTIARACADVLGEADTDVAEALFTAPHSAGRAWLEQRLCRELSDACAAPPPPLPPSRAPGPAFQPLSQQEAEMDALLRSMAGVPGMPGMSMYSRDDLADLAAMSGEGGGEEEPDDDDNDGDEPPRYAAPPTRPAKSKAQAGATAGAAGVAARVAAAAAATGAELAVRAADGAQLLAAAGRAVWAGARAALDAARRRVEL